MKAICLTVSTAPVASAQRKSRRNKRRTLTALLGVQRYITRQMRAVLVDWIVDVHAKFKVSPLSSQRPPAVAFQSSPVNVVTPGT